jgi:alpha-galactosidase/6-phospho-beta-glucosidase family protein
MAVLDDDDLVGVDTEVIRSEGAVPLPYLRLYYHTGREVQRQRQHPLRGRVLENWTARAHRAYVQSGGPDYGSLDAILAERRLNWYRDGVVPALIAFLGEEASLVSLNLPHVAADEPRGCVIELPCTVSRTQVTPLDVPPLPDGPVRLLRQLVNFEEGALHLQEDLHIMDIASVLAMHPLVRNAEIAERMAAAISARTIAANTRRPSARL